MADFCAQCSKDLGAPDGYSDLSGFAIHGQPIEVLCEGCGMTIVDDSGVCISDSCLIDHKTGQER